MGCVVNEIREVPSWHEDFLMLEFSWYASQIEEREYDMSILGFGDHEKVDGVPKSGVHASITRTQNKL